MGSAPLVTVSVGSAVVPVLPPTGSSLALVITMVLIGASEVVPAEGKPVAPVPSEPSPDPTLVPGGVEVADAVVGAVVADAPVGVAVVVAALLGSAVSSDEQATAVVSVAASTRSHSRARHRGVRPPTRPTLPSPRTGPSWTVTASQRRVTRHAGAHHNRESAHLTPNSRNPAVTPAAASTTATRGARRQASNPPTATPAGRAQPAKACPSSRLAVAISATSMITDAAVIARWVLADRVKRDCRVVPATRSP